MTVLIIHLPYPINALINLIVNRFCLTATVYPSLNVTWEDKRRLSLRQKARRKQQSTQTTSSTSSPPGSDKESVSDDNGGIICSGRRLSELSNESSSSFGDRSSCCESDSSVFRSSSELAASTSGQVEEGRAEALKNRLMVAQRVRKKHITLC